MIQRLENKNLSEYSKHDMCIYMDQWVEVCKCSFEQRHIFPPTSLRSNIEKFTSILEYLRQSCQYKPVSVVSVNFDHRTVTLFWDKCRYWQTSDASASIGMAILYSLFSISRAIPSKLDNISFNCSILIIRIYTFSSCILKIHKVLTLNMINVITLLVVKLLKLCWYTLKHLSLNDLV